MKKGAFRDCPVAVVSVGCVLPDANGIEEFWTRLMEGVPSIRPMPETRWPSADHLCPDRSDREKPYTRWASHIPDAEYDRLQAKWCKDDPALNRMRLQLLECGSQVFAPWPKGFKDRNVDFFLGAMHYEEASQQGVFDLEKDDLYRVLDGMDDPRVKQWRQEYENFRAKKTIPYCRADVMILPHFVKDMQDHFNFSGSGALVDAACASSVAALDVGLKRLISGESDMVLTGGVESFLSSTAFVSFTSMGALAPEVCLPFDRRSQGLSLGEGCVLFLLQRLEDAIRDGHQVLAVIEGVGASSDGQSASLFSPTVSGQRRAYMQSYDGLDLDRMVYLECHGTGTVLGDAVELQSSGDFFGDRQLPIGSAKSLWGHTRGAAGAVGMLKGLMVLQKHAIPPSRYVKEKIDGFPSTFRINTETEEWKSEKPAMVGVSSFGFGGINYHVTLGEWRPQEAAIKSSLIPAPRTGLVAWHERIIMDEVRGIEDWSAFKVPSRSRQQVDLTQLAALMATKRALEKAHIPMRLLDKNKVVVISASPMGLDVIKHFATCVEFYQGIPSIFPSMPPERHAEIMKLREKFPAVTEDTSAGGLNNVIAGRVCNFFDFHGKSYHIDADGLSYSLALEAAMAELQGDAEMAIVLSFDWRLSNEDFRGHVIYNAGSATLLVNERAAQRMALKINHTLKVEETWEIQ